MSVPPKIVKAVVVIVVSITMFYGLTHNPITHPTIEVVSGLSSIQLMQHPLVLGIAGHNYLALRSTDNSIIKELHGLATDSTTGTWKYVGTKSTDKLKVWEFSSSKYYLAQKNYAGIILYKGQEGTAREIWNKALPCKEEINNKNSPYPPFGVNMKGDTENSNSVAYTLTLCMGLDTKHLGLLTPGSTKNLLEIR